MTDLQKETYIKFRKKIYASINGTKGNLIKLKRSSFLRKSEKEMLESVIIELEKLRIKFKNHE